MNSHIHRSSKEGNSESKAFTLQELAVVLAVVGLLTTMLLPALARTRTNSTAAQCRNNLKQLAAAWTMYSPDNAGYLVSAYPSYASFKATWCAGNAETSGSPGASVYGGADPAGITNGLLWPYVRTLSAYKCALDTRTAYTGPTQYVGKPILRSVSMNSFLAGRSYGGSPEFVITSPSGRRDPKKPVLLKESEILQPSKIWVILEEDPLSINDGMFTVDMGGASGFVDLPSRIHNNGYGITFADGHVEEIRLTEPGSLAWGIWSPPSTNADWCRLTNMTTNPLL